VKGSDWSEAATADDGDAAALGLDPVPRLNVICGCDDVLLAETNLQRERTLPRLGQKLVRLEALFDLSGEAEAVEPAGREHNGVEPPLASLSQPRIDVAAQRFDREGRLEREQLSPPPHRRGTDPQPGPQLRDSTERVARILAREVRADDEAVGIGRRHVLRRVHRDVDPSAEQRLLELLDEDPA